MNPARTGFLLLIFATAVYRASAQDFTLDWVGRPNIDNGGLTMPDALDKQLGLKLEGRKITLPVLVIDHIERPSEN